MYTGDWSVYTGDQLIYTGDWSVYTGVWSVYKETGQCIQETDQFIRRPVSLYRRLVSLYRRLVSLYRRLAILYRSTAPRHQTRYWLCWTLPCSTREMVGTTRYTYYCLLSTYYFHYLSLKKLGFTVWRFTLLHTSTTATSTWWEAFTTAPINITRLNDSN